MAASGSENTGKMFPAATLEDQEKAMAGEIGKVTMGIPPFSSTEPHTDGQRMVSIEGGASVAADEDKKAGDWNKEVKSAANLEALAALKARYEDSGADFKSVDDALSKKYDELEAAASGGDEN